MNVTSLAFVNVSLDIFKPDSLPYQPNVSSVISTVNSKGVLLPLAGAAFFFLFFLVSFTSPKVDAPVVGYRSVFEPTLLLRLRFLFGARDIIRNGYTKVDSCVLYKDLLSIV